MAKAIKKAAPKKAAKKAAPKKADVNKATKKATPKKTAVKRAKAKPGDKRIGNQFWLVRSKHGRDKLFTTPELLWEAACEYFQWCEKNPIQDTRSFGQRKVQRPFTIQGLTAYLNCNSVYFYQFEKSLKEKTDQMSKDFSQILTDIRDTIYRQKFENAAIGVYKENIIARDLGLTDKADVTTDGEKIPGTVIKWGGKEIKV